VARGNELAREGQGDEKMTDTITVSIEATTDAQRDLLDAMADPGGAVEVASEEIGGWRHYWIGEDQWGERHEKADAPAVLAGHAAAGGRTNWVWVR
jgi:hypothetical protein